MKTKEKIKIEVILREHTDLDNILVKIMRIGEQKMSLAPVCVINPLLLFLWAFFFMLIFFHVMSTCNDRQSLPRFSSNPQMVFGKSNRRKNQLSWKVFVLHVSQITCAQSHYFNAALLTQASNCA